MEIAAYEMKFDKNLTVRDLYNGYKYSGDGDQIVAFGGKLNVKPKYQREFIYEEERQMAVINTILNDYPLNVMYWVELEDGTYELLDGQQRTLSICRFINGQFSIPVDYLNDPVSFERMKLEYVERLLNYPLMVYICKSEDKDEVLRWFKVINVSGVKLTNQEMRNSIYNSPWLSDAKRYFSKPNCNGFNSEGLVSNGHKYGDYVNVEAGTKSEKENAVVRQKLLEIALTWMADYETVCNGIPTTVESYMERFVESRDIDGITKKKPETDAKTLWRYYEDVLEWVKKTFPTYEPIMKTVDWGPLYNRYRDQVPDNADEMVRSLWDKSEEISNPKGIYQTVLTGDLRYIHARTFDKKDIQKKYSEQNGFCPYCHKSFALDQMRGDHIVPWSKGGITEYSNLQLLCNECNQKKSNYDVGYTPWDNKTYKAFDKSEWDNSFNKMTEK